MEQPHIGFRPQPDSSGKVIYLRKASDDLVSYCSCDDGWAGCPAQLDCPWCGCGWLFHCIHCQRAFTFAVGVEIDSTWEDLARKEFKALGHKDVSDEAVQKRAKAWSRMFSTVKPGVSYVYLDGEFIEAGKAHIDFEGIYSRHHFPSLPHILATTGEELRGSCLADRDYWVSNRIDGE